MSRQKNSIASSFGSQSIEPVKIECDGVLTACAARSAPGAKYVGVDAGRHDVDRRLRARRDRARAKVSRSASGHGEHAVEPPRACAFEAQHPPVLHAVQQRCAIAPVFVSACRRQISDSTLCVKSTAGQGSRCGRFTAGEQEVADDEVEALVRRAASRERALDARERYLPTAYGSGSRRCIAASA